MAGLFIHQLAQVAMRILRRVCNQYILTRQYSEIPWRLRGSDSRDSPYARPALRHDVIGRLTGIRFVGGRSLVGALRRLPRKWRNAVNAAARAVCGPHTSGVRNLLQTGHLVALYPHMRPRPPRLVRFQGPEVPPNYAVCL